jgi:FixJ family two-component response regulator
MILNSARKPVVAIVDDDPRVLESLEDLLESGGYVVHSFSSAIALLDHGLADCQMLITDIGMPGMDGFELRASVNRAYPGLPVFLITGRHELAEQARIRGGGGFFRKPFDAPALLAALGNAIGDWGKDNGNGN